MPVKIFGFDSVSRKLRKVQKSLKEPEFLDRIGRTAVSHMQDRTRAGQDAHGNLLKPLKKATIDKRKKLSAINKVSAYYSHAISNLHFTGQLVRAIKFVIEGGGLFSGAKVFVKVDESKRKPYVTKSEIRENKAGTKTKTVNTRAKAEHTPTNAELAKYQDEGGRKFLGVDDGLRQKVRELAARQVRRAVRRLRQG